MQIIHILYSSIVPLDATRARAMSYLAMLILALAGLGWPSTARAQGPGWRSVIEANANLLFGATSQTLTSVAGELSHDSDGFSADAAIKFRYGESEDAEQAKFVSSRSWSTAMSFDVRPKDRVSPFVFGSMESSLEKRISRREAGGAGAKWTFARTTTGKASLSLAVLGERTTPLSDTAATATTLARWSWRAKVDQRVDDRLSFSHITFYQPAVSGLSRYTVTSTSVGRYAINKAVALTLTFTDNYDSQARGRGARANNDGSLLFGVRATF